MSLDGKCPTGCGRDVAFGKLVCGRCWSQVPGHLQRAVTTAWANHRKLMRGDRTLEQVRESRALYEAAKENALAAIA